MVIRTRIAPPITTIGSRTRVKETGKTMHGLNGDILVWNHVTKRRHELTSMGVRVTAETLKLQLEMSNQLDLPEAAVSSGDIEQPDSLCVGAGSDSHSTLMLLLRKAHLGEVTVTVWPKILKEICAKKNIHALE